MKSILRLLTTIIFLSSLNIQLLPAASHVKMIQIQEKSAPVYSAKQAKKIKKLEKRLAKQEEKPVKWGNKAFKMLGLASLSLILGLYTLMTGPLGMFFYILSIGFSGWSMIRGVKGISKSEKGSNQQLLSILAALFGFFSFIGLIGFLPVLSSL